jgi:diaminohydroxyphosphoribosylaminopyrimidine deaminase / 5-amino-6-(5-phosphoribosylamino)uracil reductase
MAHYALWGKAPNRTMPAEGHITGRLDAQWQAVLACRRGAGIPRGDSELVELYGPLCAVPPGESFAIAHLAQSLDGRIATLNGASQWISGDEDLRHTHRLRALADAVIVGADTILHDDPLLTVRRCSGSHPARIVIDPNRKLAPHHRVFTEESAPTLVIAAADCANTTRLGHAEILRLPRANGIIAPADIRTALAARGLHWLFVEGGGMTISHFLDAGCLDRLQLTVAPMILGSGRPSLTLPEIAAPGLARRPKVRRASLGEDTLFECIFVD